MSDKKKKNDCGCGNHEHDNCTCNEHDHDCDCHDEDCSCCHGNEHQHEHCSCGGEHGNHLIDVIFDENNCDNIFLEDSEGKEMEFEQIAVVPFGEDLYIMLHPVSGFEQISDDDAFVFLICPTEDGEDVTLSYVEDMKTVNGVFAVYDKMYEDAVANGEIVPDDGDDD